MFHWLSENTHVTGKNDSSDDQMFHIASQAVDAEAQGGSYKTVIARYLGRFKAESNGRRGQALMSSGMAPVFMMTLRQMPTTSVKQMFVEGWLRDRILGASGGVSAVLFSAFCAAAS